MCAPEGFATAWRPQAAIFGRQKLVSRCSHSVRSSPCKMGAAASFLMLYTDWEWPMRLRGRFAPAWRPHGTIFGRQKLVSRWSHSCDHLPAKWGESSISHAVDIPAKIRPPKTLHYGHFPPREASCRPRFRTTPLWAIPPHVVCTPGGRQPSTAAMCDRWRRWPPGTYHALLHLTIHHTHC